MRELMPKKLFTIFIGVIIFFVIGEIGYRFYLYTFKPLYRPSKIYGLQWEPTPHADVIRDGIRYRINSLGLRDYEYTVNKGKGVIRIIAIGDSTTFGYTDVKDTYPNVLERELRKKFKGKRFEVLNFGIEGVDSKHELDILKERAVKFDPDLVIVGYCLNDIRFMVINPVLLWIMEHSNFCDFLAVKIIETARIWRAKTGLVTNESYFKFIIGLYEDEERILKLRNILREMKTILYNENRKLIVAVFPFREQFKQNASLKPQSIVRAICKDEGITFFDLLSDLKKYDPDKIYLKGDSVHFTVYGNELRAKSIMNFIIEGGIIPPIKQ